MPLSEISVSDVTDFCDLSRNTFYYHFKDKQELIFWIYTNFHDSSINLTVTENKHTNTLELINYMQKYPSFFRQAFTETGQNCFKSEFQKSMHKDYAYVLDKNYDTAATDPLIKDFIAKYYSHCSVEAFEMLLNIPPHQTEKYINIYLSLLSRGLSGTVNALVPKLES
jgi:AcrR family transcriptional regulator